MEQYYIFRPLEWNPPAEGAASVHRAFNDSGYKPPSQM